MKSKLLFFIVGIFSYSAFAQIDFQKEIIIDASHHTDGPKSIFSADIDNDGDMDILSASYEDDKISWFENIGGDGEFLQHLITYETNEAQYVYAADIDGDGDLDVLSASSTKIFWFENLDGLGYFSEANLVSTLSDANFVLGEDVDGDGDIDVIAGSRNPGWSSGQIGWYENIDGLGSFGSFHQIQADDALSLGAADIDNDGDIDLIRHNLWFENINDSVDWDGHLYYNSSGPYSSSVVFPVDVNGDGDIDIVTGGVSSLFWFENIDGLGGFSDAILISEEFDVSSLFSNDLDGDGDMDLIFTSGNDVLWLENTDSLGSFSVEHSISIDSVIFTSIYSEDFDGDGDMDVISASKEGDVIVLFENIDGLGDFGEPKKVTKEGYANSISIMDLDGDEDLDVLASDSFNLVWYENLDGIGSFGPQKIIDSVDGSISSFPADIDGDGDADIVSMMNSETSSFYQHLLWYENLDGLGDFGMVHQIGEDTIHNLEKINGSDLDLDGDIDILFVEDGTIFWVENIDGAGNFNSPQFLASGSDAIFVATSDLDGDGDEDLVSSNLRSWQMNDGAPPFPTGGYLTNTSWDTPYVTTADLDGDNDQDIVSAIGWFENSDGLGDFNAVQEIDEFRPTSGYGVVTCADLDNDGDVDVVSSYRNSNKLVWNENIDGLGSFGDRFIIDNSYSTVSGYKNDIKVADIDSDGDLDIVRAKFDEVVLYRNGTNPDINIVDGYIKLDTDSNGCDENDLGLMNLMVTAESSTGNSESTFSTVNGYYKFFLSQDNYEISLSSSLPNYFLPTPNSHFVAFDGFDNTFEADFCLEPIGVVNDLSISIYPSMNEPRPGLQTSYRIVFSNVGTTQLDGSIDFEYNESKLNFLSTSGTISSQTSNSITFDYIDFNPYETRIIELEMEVFAPPTTNIDDLLISTATISPIAEDETEENNVTSLEQIVIGSYDPNDIRVLEGDEILYADIDKYLHYIIRFQNTGTASAINVSVKNELSYKLDWSTMHLESLSHEGRVEITDGRNVEFIFDDINLPDIINDEPNSHGFIAYKIKPKNSVNVGDVFYNTADIFFDFNPAIVTNTVSTEIVENLSVDDFELQDILVYPNPINDVLHIEANQSITFIQVYNLLGQRLLTLTPNTLAEEINLTYFNSGIYLLKVEVGGQINAVKVIKQ